MTQSKEAFLGLRRATTVYNIGWYLSLTRENGGIGDQALQSLQPRFELGGFGPQPRLELDVFSCQGVYLRSQGQSAQGGTRNLTDEYQQVPSGHISPENSSY